VCDDEDGGGVCGVGFQIFARDEEFDVRVSGQNPYTWVYVFINIFFIFLILFKVYVLPSLLITP